MANLPYNATQGADLFSAVQDFKAMDDAYDSLGDNPYLWNAADRAEFRDYCQYTRQDTVIGNAKKIQGVDVSTTAPTKGQLLVYDDVSDEYAPNNVPNNPVHNATGGLLTEITPVYLTGSVTSGVANVAESDASASGSGVDARDVHGVLTTDIADGADGASLSGGIVSDVDTSIYDVGDELWLAEGGGITTTKPLLPSSQIRLGVVLVKSSTVGVVDIQVKDLSWAGAVQSSNQSTERTGFILNTSGEAVDTAGGAVSITSDNATRTLTVSGASGAFPIFSQDNLFIKVGDQEKVWTDVEGDHFFYFDETGTIQHSVTFDNSFILGPDVFIAYLQWDAVNKEVILDGPLCEYHGIQMDGATHYHFHRNLGARAESGLTLGDIISDGNGSLDTHAQFSIANGVISDEDLRFDVIGKASTSGTRVLGLEGSTPVLRQYTKTGFSVITDLDVTTKAGTTTGRLVYNYFDGTDWVYDAVTNNNYVLCHSFAIGICGGGQQLYSIPGQVEYTTVGDAREGALIEINSIVQALPFAEVRPISSVILQTGSTYANAVKARIRPDDAGNDYVDHRQAGSVGGIGLATAEHNNLAGLDNAGTDGVIYGHLTNEQYEQITSPNLLINADGTDPLDQRGVDGTTISSGSYTFDRWYLGHNCTQVDMAVQAGGGLRTTITTAGAGTYVELYQLVEDFDKLDGKEVTISASIKSNAEARLRVYNGSANTIITSTHTGGGTFEVLSGSGAYTSGTLLRSIMEIVSGVADGKYIEFEWIKLEVGSVATPFVADLPGVNLAKCLRYYERISSNNAFNLYGPCVVVSATTAFLYLKHSPKRSGAWTLGSSGNFAISTGGGQITVTGISLSTRGDGSTKVLITVAGGLTSNVAYMVLDNNDTTAYIELPDEL